MKKIKTLAMLKMEKNFVAHIEKKYPRQPYLKAGAWYFLERIKTETEELTEALKAEDVEGAKLECADISNLVDYLFETLERKGQKNGEKE